MSATPRPIDRKLYGDLADDIVLLRSDGRIVARYKSGFRVDSWPEIFTAAQVRGMAATVRNRRLSAATALVTKNGHEIAGTDAPRSRMAAHKITRTAVLDTRPGGSASVHTEPDVAPAVHFEPPTADVPDKFWRAVGPVPAGDPGQPGGSHVARTTDHQPVGQNSDEGPAGGEKPATPAGGSHDAGLTPAPEVARPATPATDLAARLADNPLGALCGCGALRTHGGRCWHRRGLGGPIRASGKKTRKERRSLGITARLTALECEVDALKLANTTLKESGARLEKDVAELRALMSMEGLR